MVVIDGIILKGRCIIIPEILKTQVLDQLHINHMGIEKTKLLIHESIYRAHINDDIENFIKDCTTCLTFQQTQPKDKMICLKSPELLKQRISQLNHWTSFCSLLTMATSSGLAGNISSKEKCDTYQKWYWCLFGGVRGVLDLGSKWGGIRGVEGTPTWITYQKMML